MNISYSDDEVATSIAYASGSSITSTWSPCDQSLSKESSGDENICGDPYALPLYAGANLSVFDSYFLAFQFFMRHSLTASAFSQLLD